MNDENFKRILFLILKVIIKNNGFLSQLEIFRDVRFLMNKYFNLKESDLIVKLPQGRSEDFKDILNFILTILCELAIVSQKMENKSFYFKWNGFKGFRKKYLLDFVSNNQSNFEMSDSFEHRIQIYTRMVLLELYKHPDGGITFNGIDNYIKLCGLENQQRHTDKIHSILKLINFSFDERPTSASVATPIFTLSNSSSTKGDLVAFKINKVVTDENLIKDNNYADKFAGTFNDFILTKFESWNEMLKNERIEFKNEDVEMSEPNEPNVGKSTQENNDYKLDSTTKEINDFENLKMNINKFNTENEEVGFAILKGNNWSYYLKKLYCIIGRAPVKYGVQINSLNNSKIKNTSLAVPTENLGNTTWHVDVDLGQCKKVSKQHALISYNSQTCSFEIINLSKKHPIKVNGEFLNYGEDMLLTSKSLVNIGNQEFYFLLAL